jgi:site-specific DNA-methyltransferase (adenine-specific)
VVFDRTAGEALDQQSGVSSSAAGKQQYRRPDNHAWAESKGMWTAGREWEAEGYGNSGGASRFFTQADFGPDDWPFVYQAKPSRRERNAGLDALPEQQIRRHSGGEYAHNSGSTASSKNGGASNNHHPTVKPVALMRHLVRLVTPPGGTVLDPFAGSGTTLVAAILEGMVPLGCEMTDEYLSIIEGRMAWAHEQVAARVEAEANPAQPTLL